MEKNIVKINEEQLKKIVAESVKRVLKEAWNGSMTDYQNMANTYNHLGGYTTGNMPSIPRGMRPEDYYAQLSAEKSAREHEGQHRDEVRKSEIEMVRQKITNIPEVGQYLLNTETKLLNDVRELSGEQRQWEYKYYARQMSRYMQQLGLMPGYFCYVCDLCIENGFDVSDLKSKIGSMVSYS